MGFEFLRNKAAIAVTAVLLVQIIAFFLYPKNEFIPSPPPLTTFATSIGPWEMVRQWQIDEETQNLLKADDTLSRLYAGPSAVDFFVAFFKTQRGGVTPHSPKVCLPGNGWTPEASRTIKVDLPGEKPIDVNQFVVNNNGDRKLILYWYQNPNRVTADEYLSKVYLVWDSLRFHRSDEAMIRVIVDITASTPENVAQGYAKQFIQTVFTPLKAQMWANANTNAALLIR